MTQEDKDLLVKDLCARLPYGVKVNVTYSIENASSFRQQVCSEGVNVLNTDIIWLYQCNEIGIRTYLFPMSSMTEEQKKKFMEVSNCEMQLNEQYGYDSEGNYIIIIGEYEYNYDENITTDCFYPNFETFDWLHRNHFDYRGLIEKGLAIDATGLNIY